MDRLLKDLKKIDTDDERFKDLAVQLKRRIFEYVPPREGDGLEKTLWRLQK